MFDVVWFDYACFDYVFDLSFAGADFVLFAVWCIVMVICVVFFV